MKVIDKSDFFQNLKRMETSQYYVAYMDILGTKEIIAKDTNDKYLNDLNNIYMNTILDAEQFIGEQLKGIITRIFSDNILFAIEAGADTENDSDKMSLFIQLVGHFQNNALKKGYLVRGGITKGSFFASENFIYGKALVDAVELEEKNAIYPRVILQTGLEQRFDCFIREDTDGFYYVDNYCCATTSIVGLTQPKIIDMLDKNKNNNKIKQKICWLVTYHNSYINMLLAKDKTEFANYIECFIAPKDCAKLVYIQ